MSFRAGIALGSNLGNRLLHLRQARDRLRNEVAEPDSEFLQAPLYLSEPVGCPPGSPDFFNSVCEIEFEGTPRELLSVTQGIEQDLGRLSQNEENAPRVIDLDILYFGDLVVREEDLTIPHPRITDRRFVLLPLSEICPSLILPDYLTTIEEHLQRIDSDEPEPSLIQAAW